ncbi:MAG: hypothetical protein H7Z74_01735 [Anaerolineae bacterium]|nr:hypothetical protein [Gemmatimonadaceae bacterium]
MAAFFPRHSVDWHLEEPPFIRRLTLSLAATAVVAGVVVRLYRLAVLTYSPSNIWAFLIMTAGGVILVLGLATAHLGNFPVRHWLWRAPAFGAIEAIAFVATGALLLAAGVERVGTELMHWHDWSADLLTVLLRHIVTVSIFAAVLAGVVQIVRRYLIRHPDSAISEALSDT